MAERHLRAVEAAVPEARRALVPSGLDHLLDGLSSENAYKVFEMLGLSRDPRAVEALDRQLVLRAREAVLDEEVHAALRRVSWPGKTFAGIGRSPRNSPSRSATPSRASWTPGVGPRSCTRPKPGLTKSANNLNSDVVGAITCSRSRTLPASSCVSPRSPRM